MMFADFVRIYLEGMAGLAIALTIIVAVVLACNGVKK